MKIVFYKHYNNFWMLNEWDFDAFESDIAIDNRQRAFVLALFTCSSHIMRGITMDFQLTNS